MSSTQDPNSNVSNSQNIIDPNPANVNPVSNNASNISDNSISTNTPNTQLDSQNQQVFNNNLNGVNNDNSQIVNPLRQNNQPVSEPAIPMYEPEIIKDYNPYAQEVSTESPLISNNKAQNSFVSGSNTNYVQNQNNITPSQNNVFTGVGANQPSPEIPVIQNPMSQPNQVGSTAQPITPEIQVQGSQTESFVQPVLPDTYSQQSSLPQPQAVVEEVKPTNEYEGKKKRKNIFSIFFNFLPSIILVGLIALIVIIAKNFIDKTTITDFSEIGPAIIFETEFNKSSGKLEWLLLPPTPLGLTTDAPRDFEVADKVTITCPIKSSNDLMDIVQSIINPKLGSCAFRNI